MIASKADVRRAAELIHAPDYAGIDALRKQFERTGSAASLVLKSTWSAAIVDDFSEQQVTFHAAHKQPPVEVDLPSPHSADAKRGATESKRGATESKVRRLPNGGLQLRGTGNQRSRRR